MMTIRKAAAFLLLAALLMTSVPSHAEEANVIKWNALAGWTYPGLSVSTIAGVGFPWFLRDGSAETHLATGHIKFTVKGLVLANSTPLAVGGTIGVTQQVKGTLVCNDLSNAASDYVDTPSVPLDPQGNAMFVGEISIPNACLLTPDKLAFLVRIAEAPLNPSLVDHWAAIGMVRTP